MDVYAKMKELGICLPAAPARGGLYTSCQQFADTLYYVSGCGPVLDAPVTGTLGLDVTVEQGQVYARSCMLNVLAALEKEIGDLRRVKTWSRSPPLCKARIPSTTSRLSQTAAPGY